MYKKTYKIYICGTPLFHESHRQYIKAVIENETKSMMEKYQITNKDLICFVGNSKGLDFLIRQTVIKLHIIYRISRPDWYKYRSKARSIRDERLINVSDFTLIFWDGRDAEATYQVALCKKYKREYRLVNLTDLRR